MVNKLNKKIIQFISLIVCFFCVFNVSTLNVKALDTTTTSTVVGINDFNFDASSGLSFTRTGTKPYIFDSATTGNINIQSRLLYPQVTLSGSSNSGFWTLYMDVYVFTQADGQPVITCPNTAVGAKYVLDSCDVISGGSYNYSEVSSGSWSFNNSGSGNIPQNSLYFNSSSVITHYILTLNGHVATSGYDTLINLRGDFLQVNTGIYQLSVSLSNVRFFTSESAESQAVNNQTEQQQEHYEEQQNQAEQQGQDAQDSSDETQSQVDGKTQNLFSFITSFFGAFTSASPSNCNFDWGLADKGFGVINMCQTNIPVELQSILSIVSILIVVPMVLWLINSIVGAFKEFQQ